MWDMLPVGTFSTILVAKGTTSFYEAHSESGVIPLWCTNKCDQVMHEESEFDEP